MVVQLLDFEEDGVLGVQDGSQTQYQELGSIKNVMDTMCSRNVYVSLERSANRS